METFAATPSSTSLRTLLLHAVLRQYQVTSRDISPALFNTPIEEDVYVQPPPEVYIDLESSGSYIVHYMVGVHHRRCGRNIYIPHFEDYICNN